MSWLKKDKSGNFHVRFRFGGTKFRRSLRTKEQKAADARLNRLDESIRLVESDRLDWFESSRRGQQSFRKIVLGKSWKCSCNRIRAPRFPSSGSH